MSDINLDAYIFFTGNCQEAMELYKSIFGGELSVMSWDQMPPEGGQTDVDMTGMKSAEEMKGKVMHASLTGGIARLMGADTPRPELGTGKISLSLSGADEAKLTDIFNKLSEGGQVVDSLKKQFWGDTFGVVTDKFGVDWMVNINGQHDQAA